ncbi:hypothetical protein M9H77_07545 [Catharanthus roseus]|uniref:Uncharacterized protein n=1 Tax=Catharanthus roseus TaxID=4058 RepID=A0ACC0BV71_CATRO|nr:hypothetical protein M9H77_07545 [Catharanthus roseus]
MFLSPINSRGFQVKCVLMGIVVESRLWWRNRRWIANSLLLLRAVSDLGGSGFGRGSGLPSRTFYLALPTNGDPNYDFKKMKPPTGIPKSMLMSNSDGFYALSNGDVAVLKPDEVAFEREIQWLPTTRSRHIGDVPKELYCQLCKKIMNFAVLCSKCCFESFCDQCIRNYIISKISSVGGATDTLADDLLPNFTLRKTINRIVEPMMMVVKIMVVVVYYKFRKESNNALEDKVTSTTKSTASVKEVAAVDEVAEEGMADNCVVEGIVVGLQELAPNQGTTVPWLMKNIIRKLRRQKGRKFIWH